MIPFGRIPSESLAECHHNPWPDAVRMVGRMSSESLAGCHRNMHSGSVSTGLMAHFKTESWLRHTIIITVYGVG